ncbi:MAG TPA: glycosyltransferase family 4 protein [Gemmatimonadaceae bacterium]|nr:glycosyltransferase family 4 protein [Gemmatimonadaceae bacterium]
MKSILIQLHVQSNTGFAIGPLEAAFFSMALELTGGDAKRIHFAYPTMARGPSDTLPADFSQYVVTDARTEDPAACRRAGDYVANHGIDTIFGFDQPVRRPIYRAWRDAGVKHFVSYWGGPMSSINGILKRTLKRIDVALSPTGPDHYIFESHGMAEAAVLGRGVPRSRTTVVRLGVDTDRYRPENKDARYIFDHLRLPPGKRVFFYSGHMHSIKGVDVLMRAANTLAEFREADDWRVALFGNRNGDEQEYVNMLSAKAKPRVVFGGYRSDLNMMHRGSYAGVIASTGWDSLALSGVEMQSSGLPLIASNIRGLQESVVPGMTGMLFPPGDHAALAAAMAAMLNDPATRDRLALQARARIEKEFSTAAQVRNLVQVMRGVLSRN